MKRRSLKLIRLEVSADDIEEMFDRYDSGMADHTTANAISIALARTMKSGNTPRIVSASRHNSCQLDIGGETFPLPREVFWWLDRVGRNHQVYPTSFSLALPEEILCFEDPPTEVEERPIAALI